MDNPFLAPSPLPHGLPDFTAIRDEHYAPAFDAGMAEQRDEVEAIVSDPEPATFDNTLLPLERSGRVLDRVSRVFFNRVAADSTPVIEEIQTEYAPRLAAHADAIRLDPRLYARISAVYDAREQLDPEERYLVERYRTEMTLTGAALGDADKQRLTEINQRLSTLTTRFEKNLLADTNELAVVVDSAEELDGMSPDAISAAAQAAHDRGLDGKYLLTLHLYTNHPALASLTDRDLRRRLHEASRARGSRGGEHDNREIVLEIVRLRAERARLLGFDTHAAAVTADETAGSPKAVAEMLGRLAPAAARNARREQAALEERAGHPVEAWDWSFRTEEVRRASYSLDTAAMRPFFEAERVLWDGVFHAATRLYGVRFTERDDLVGYRPDVRVFEVYEEDGSSLGLFLLDLYTRDSKKGGAWMNSLVVPASLLGHDTSVVVNNLNVPRPAPGEPTLLTYDEVRTFFHEFGHALHGLFGRTRFPKFAGTSVFRDFVEFPSQVNEMWILWPEVLEHYAVHHETGEPMPAEWAQALRDSQSFNEGFATSEYLAAALLDQAWHSLTVEQARAVDDVAAFEAAALAEVGLDIPAVPPRYSSTYFAHVFAGEYDAGYYSYVWSEVLDADTVEWFRENGGLRRENGDRFRGMVLGIGGSRDPLAAYREFRGRDAEIEPLLRRRGLTD